MFKKCNVCLFEKNENDFYKNRNNCKKCFISSIKKCIEPNCKTRPSFNKPGEDIGIYCNIHKTSIMVNVISKKCIEINCKTQPSFNNPGELEGIYCNIHKTPIMVNVLSKMCIEQNCNTIPCFNNPGELEGIYCSKHKTSIMVNVVSKTCLEPNCDKRVDKYPFCSNCHRFKDPNHPRFKNVKQKELYITNKLKQDFGDVSLIFDSRINCQDCTKRRPDVFIDLFGYCIIIEIDENQHSNYQDEIKRIKEIKEALGNRKLVVIRFNPDAYKTTTKFKSIFKFGMTGIISTTKYFTERYSKLSETLKFHLSTTPTQEITTEFLYYND